MRLSHLHIPHFIPYSHSLALQTILQTRYFNYKDHLRALQRSKERDTASHSAPSATPAQPNPTLLTFSTYPTYTIGRRHLESSSNALTSAEIDFLTGKTNNLPYAPKDLEPEQAQIQNDTHTPSSSNLATFQPSPRGGLLTYHGPGQLTAFVVLDLRAHHLIARKYISILEQTVIKTCRALGVPNAVAGTIEDMPGIWIHDGTSSKKKQDEETESKLSRKICAVGVQISRGVTGFGVGLNVFDHPILPVARRDVYFPLDLSEKDRSRDRGYLSWGFGRIVACGLEGKTTTWLAREGLAGNGFASLTLGDKEENSDRVSTRDEVVSQGKEGMRHVADVFAREFAMSLGLVDSVGNPEVERIPHDRNLIESNR